MPQQSSNAYPYFSGSTTFNVPDLWSNPNFLSQYQGRWVGTDMRTGQRDQDIIGSLLQPIVGQPPSVSTTEQDLTPNQLSPEQYRRYVEELEPIAFRSAAKQNLLGLGTATAFGAASLPFTEYMRNQDLARQMSAFKAREESPTAQAARSASLQSQLESARTGSANKLEAYARAKAAMINALRSR